MERKVKKNDLKNTKLVSVNFSDPLNVLGKRIK